MSDLSILFEVIMSTLQLLNGSVILAAWFRVGEGFRKDSGRRSLARRESPHRYLWLPGWWSRLVKRSSQ